jgi:hypothetical protein
VLIQRHGHSCSACCATWTDGEWNSWLTCRGCTAAAAAVAVAVVGGGGGCGGGGTAAWGRSVADANGLSDMAHLRELHLWLGASHEFPPCSSKPLTGESRSNALHQHFPELDINSSRGSSGPQGPLRGPPPPPPLRGVEPYHLRWPSQLFMKQTSLF